MAVIAIVVAQGTAEVSSILCFMWCNVWRSFRIYSLPFLIDSHAFTFIHVLCNSLPFLIDSHAFTFIHILYTDSTTHHCIDDAIDPARVLLVGMHGLSWNPIVASYTDFLASNAQLHCSGEKYAYQGIAPSLKDSMVVVRRKV